MRIASLLAVTACLSLSGCQISYPVEVSGTLEQPLITIEPVQVMFRDTPICIMGFAVYDEAASRSSPIWAADAARRDQADRPDCVEVIHIYYGAAPEGFRVTAPPRPLRAGVVYRVVSDSPGATGGVRVAFAAGRWRVVDHDGVGTQDQTN